MSSRCCKLNIEVLQLIADIFLAIVAIPALLVAISEWRATRDQYKEMIESNRIARESGQRQDRAYVNVQTNNRPQLSYAENSGMFVFEPTIKNAGRTPARNLSPRIDIFQLPKENKVGPSFDSLPIASASGISIGPDQEWTLKSRLDLLTADEREGQREGARLVWVVGRIEYDDVFGTPCSTRFKFRQLPMSVSYKDGVRTFDMEIVELAAD